MAVPQTVGAVVRVGLADLVGRAAAAAAFDAPTGQAGDQDAAVRPGCSHAVEAGKNR